MMRTIWVLGTVLVWATAAPAATVTFDVVTSLDSPQSQVTVDPGQTVSYVITVLVTPDDPTDNSGLASGVVDLVTNLTVAQPLADEVNSVLMGLFPTKGAPQEDDLEGIGGSQNLFQAGQTVVFARGQAVMFARGSVQTPEVPGTYTVGLASQGANVLDPDLSTVPVRTRAAEVLIGAGFTIVVRDLSPPVVPDPGIVPEPPPPPPPAGPCGAGIGGFAALSFLGLWGLCSGRRRLFA